MSIIYLLIGQREVSYPGQYAPEALAVADEFCMDDNPDYMMGQLDKYTKSKEFTALEIIKVNIDADFSEILNRRITVSGKVV